MKFSQIRERRDANRQIFVDLCLVFINIKAVPRSIWGSLTYEQIDHMIKYKTKVLDSEESIEL